MKKLILIVLVLISSSAMGKEYCKWIALDNTDCGWFMADSVLLVADALQTHQIAAGVMHKNGTISQEANKILGPRPSNSKINLYFAGWIAASYAVNRFAPNWFKHGYNGGLIALELAVINHNYKLGIRVKFK